MKALKLPKPFQPHKNCYEVGVYSVSKEMQKSKPEKPIAFKEPWFKYRHVITFVSLLSLLSINAYRVNMSITIVAMVNNSALPKQDEARPDSCPMPLLNNTSSGFGISSQSDRNGENGEFHWSPKIQGYILGSYYLVYVLVQVPFGKMVERYGCKWFMVCGTVTAALATMAIPVASALHAYVLIVIQLLRAVGQGFYLSGTALLAANWFPTLERGFSFAVMQSGYALGACFGSIFSGLLCKSAILGGWKASFYAFGIAGLLLAAVIALFIYESPDDHPHISKAELAYIITNQEHTLCRRRPNPPWKKILTSMPVYGLTIGIFGQLWAMSQFIIVHSTFLGTILHYPIKENGYLTAVPFILMFICTHISSWLSAAAARKKIASACQLRKFWNFVSCLGFSSCLMGVYFAGCDRSLSILFSVLSVGFIGFGLSGCCIVPADMSPTFAASLNALCCTFGCLPTFILPVVVGYITNGMQTIEQWNKVFLMSVGVVMTCAVTFQVLGSAAVQPWNDVTPPSDLEKNKDSKF